MNGIFIPLTRFNPILDPLCFLLDEADFVLSGGLRLAPPPNPSSPSRGTRSEKSLSAAEEDEEASAVDASEDAEAVVSDALISAATRLTESWSKMPWGKTW